MTGTKTNPFIDHLQLLAAGQDRGALAALRRGLGRPVGAAPEMFRYVEPFLPEKRSLAQEAAYYLVAALFAFHPLSTDQGNMGTHLARTRSDQGSEALERRFTALLSCHVDDLPEYLRQAVSFLKSKDVPVNWNELFWNIQRWDDENHTVQKRWAAAFWGKTASTNSVASAGAETAEELS